jgi:hypothetical protein
MAFFTRENFRGINIENASDKGFFQMLSSQVHYAKSVKYFHRQVILWDRGFRHLLGRDSLRLISPFFKKILFDILLAKNTFNKTAFYNFLARCERFASFQVFLSFEVSISEIITLYFSSSTMMDSFLVLNSSFISSHWVVSSLHLFSNSSIWA